MPMPPTLAATGMDRARPARGLPAGSAPSTGMTTANMVAVVAVLDMNMLSKAVMIIRPRTVLRAEPVKGRMRTAARFLSRWYFSAPSAMRKPPRNRMMTGLASAPRKEEYFAASSGTARRAWSETRSTSRAMTRTAVATSGIASVTHRTIASRKMESIRSPSGSRSGTSMRKGAMKTIAPRTRPMSCLVDSPAPLPLTARAGARERVGLVRVERAEDLGIAPPGGRRSGGAGTGTFQLPCRNRRDCMQ